MFNILIGKSHKHKYVKCSNCKIIDSISPLYSHPICQSCHRPLKEISEEEYKQKIANLKKIKEEIRKMRENNNINNNINNDINSNYRNIDNNNNNEEDFNNRHRNNSSLHSSKIQFNNNNDNNNNINNINNNNNSNNNNHHHGHHGIQIIKVIRGGNHGNHNIIGIRRDNSSDRENNAGHRINRMIIIRPSTHHHNNNNNNINININNNGINYNNRNIPINNNQNMQIITNNHNQNPFRIVVQRQHVPNHIFDPNFSLFGSTFDHVFQENFSSNFRSNFRGNFVNEILNAISFNRAELRRSKRQHPISKENAQKLKKFNLTQEYCKKDEKGNYEKPNCCICLEEIELGKETLLLPCGHMFHSKCGFTWLEKSNTCPICRFEIK